MNQAPLIQPDPRLQRRLLWTLAVVGPALCWPAYRLGLYLEALAHSADPRDQQQGLQLLQWLLWSAPLFSLTAAGWLLWLARRIRRAGRFPAPGQWIVHPVRLRTGGAARRLAWLATGFAALLIVVAGYLSYICLRFGSLLAALTG